MTPYVIEALVGTLPSWVAANTDSAAFINKFMGKMWPYLE